ncbi:MAG: hypothetical protein ACUVQI_08495 [Thermochromatium sp.]
MSERILAAVGLGDRIANMSSTISTQVAARWRHCCWSGLVACFGDWICVTMA